MNERKKALRLLRKLNHNTGNVVALVANRTYFDGEERKVWDVIDVLSGDSAYDSEGDELPWLLGRAESILEAVQMAAEKLAREVT